MCSTSRNYTLCERTKLRTLPNMQPSVPMPALVGPRRRGSQNVFHSVLARRSVSSRDAQQVRDAFWQSPAFLSRLTPMKTYEEHTGCVNTLHWNSQGTLLLSGSDDCRVCVWDLSGLRKAVKCASPAAHRLSTCHCSPSLSVATRATPRHLLVSLGGVVAGRLIAATSSLPSLSLEAAIIRPSRARSTAR